MIREEMDQIDHNANPVDVYMKWSQIGYEAQDVETEGEGGDGDSVGVKVNETPHMKRINLMKNNWSNITQETIGKYVDLS